MWHESSWNSAWDTWWHYKEGAIGGPSHWGQTALMSYAQDVWPACHRGQLQSPINISSSRLTYDPTLQPLRLLGDGKQVDLDISNSGQDLRMQIVESSNRILLGGGPLSYEYQLFGMLLKFGRESTMGSDHRIDGYAFPAELQIYAFNPTLYEDFSSAVSAPNGLAAVSILLKIGSRPSADLSALLSTAKDVQLKGQSRRLNGLLLPALLPSLDQYMTYQGSLPFPACHETVTWIVLNQAVVITESQLKSLRQLRIGPFTESGRMADNFRPPQQLNNRSVRTNIDFADKPQTINQPADPTLSTSETFHVRRRCDE